MRLIDRLRPYTLLFAFMAPMLAIAGFLMGGHFYWTGFLFAGVLAPLLDVYLGDSEQVLPTSFKFDFLRVLFTPVQVGAVIFCLYQSSQPQSTWVDILAMSSSLGLVFAPISFVLSHELMHRRGTLNQICCLVNLSVVSATQYQTVHMLGHHVLAGTPMDPESARKGETLYGFVFRFITVGWLFAMKRKPLKTAILTGIQAMIWIAIWRLFGSNGVLLFLLQSIIGCLTVSATLYMMHYGLERREISPGKYEPYKNEHAWDSMANFSNLMYIGNLGHHAEHHERPSAKVEKLVKVANRHLPASYPALTYLCFIPPLWFRKIHPFIERKEPSEASITQNN